MYVSNLYFILVFLCSLKNSAYTHKKSILVRKAYYGFQLKKNKVFFFLGFFHKLFIVQYGFDFLVQLLTFDAFNLA